MQLFFFKKISKESYIVIKLCNNYFLLFHKAKILKLQSMKVMKTLSILIQRKQCLIVILTFKSHQNKKSINSIVACLMISLMIIYIFIWSYTFLSYSEWFMITQARVLQVKPQIEKWIAYFRSTSSSCHNICGKHLIWQARTQKVKNIWERKGSRV